MNLETYIETLPNGFTFPMRLIPRGRFDMGSRDLVHNLQIFEKPLRKNVSVSPFYLAPLLTTQALWKSIMGTANNPSGFIGDNRPVEKVSWLDTQTFINSLNLKTSVLRAQKGVGPYRLPTEAEWEYAARGGNQTLNYEYAGSDKLKEVGWFRINSGYETQEVGKLLPNSVGIFDMSGNVWEWVEDHWHRTYQGAPRDSRAWIENDFSAQRTLRGGSCFDQEQDCRVACRNGNAPIVRLDSYGFRLALSLV